MILSVEAASGGRSRSGVGVSHHELVQLLSPVVADLACPVLIVTGRSVKPLTDLVTSVLEANGSGPPLVATDPHAAIAWAAKHTGPVAVLSYLSMWQWDEAGDHLARLLSATESGSRLVFVEPSLGAGWWSRLQTIAQPLFRRRMGVSFNRDIPAVVRATGWRPTTVKRTSVGVPAALLTFVVGEARNYRTEM